MMFQIAAPVTGMAAITIKREQTSIKELPNGNCTHAFNQLMGSADAETHTHAPNGITSMIQDKIAAPHPPYSGIHG